eukprot:1637974-Heterocapsa_arctica.AAC.1
MRLMRLTFFEPLFLLFKSLRASFSVLSWSLALLIMAIAMVAITVGENVESFTRDPEIDLAIRTE